MSHLLSAATVLGCLTAHGVPAGDVHPATDDGAAGFQRLTVRVPGDTVQGDRSEPLSRAVAAALLQAGYDVGRRRSPLAGEFLVTVTLPETEV